MNTIEIFDYDALEKELGEFPRWKKFDGMICKFSGKENSYYIVGTKNPVRLVEKQWIKKVNIKSEELD